MRKTRLQDSPWGGKGSSARPWNPLMICNSFSLLPPATKLGQGYVFTGVCHSVNRGGGSTWPGTPPPRDQVHPPPGTRCTPPRDKVHPPPGQVHPPRDQVHPPLGTRYPPPGPGTPPPRDQVHPPPRDQVHPPLGPGTPPWTRYTPPRDQVHPPRDQVHPPLDQVPPPRRDQVHPPPVNSNFFNSNFF